MNWKTVPAAALVYAGGVAHAHAQAGPGAGRLVLTPSLSLGAAYDGNVQGTSEAVSDGFGQATLGLRLDWRWTKRRTLSLSGDAGAERYLDQEALSSLTSSQRVSASLSQTLSSAYTFNAGGTYQRSQRPGEVVESSGLTLARGTSGSYGGSVGIERNLGRGHVSLGYSYRVQDLAGSERDETHAVNVGASRRMAASFTLNMSAGGRETAAGPRGEGSLSAQWKLRRAQLSFGAHLADNAGPDAETRLLTTSVSGNVQYALARRLAVGLGGGYFWTRVKEEFVDAYRGQLELTWKATRRATMGGGCSWMKQRVPEHLRIEGLQPGLERSICAMGISFAPSVRLN